MVSKCHLNDESVNEQTASTATINYQHVSVSSFVLAGALKVFSAITRYHGVGEIPAQVEMSHTSFRELPDRPGPSEDAPKRCSSPKLNRKDQKQILGDLFKGRPNPIIDLLFAYLNINFLMCSPRPRLVNIRN